ncbi:hypothetical protein RHSIM_Rhsim02G0179900 [Rhododendron simsii]|uniref:Aminotransferase-like plant mobile domain-containing protein n=1 Tax=Rhododendron simsii TaxID=118357 RepID=A0A834HN47_RHOSS|nr:hypothetical protein RHSIM_Rhsim02G0179900 [Rhododendron simsii]
MDFTSKTIEYLRCNHGDIPDKSGPKVARHQSIYDSLTSTQRSPYILPDNIDDLIYSGMRKCSEIDGRGFFKDQGSSHISLLRPFSRNEVDDSVPGSNFNLLLKKMKNEGVENINVFKAFLELWSPDTNTFHATYGEVGFSLWDLHRISGLPILGGLYEEYTPTNDLLYSDRTRSTCRALFDIYANKEKSKNLSLWSSYFVESHADFFQRRQNISDEVYLAGFLTSWLSNFVLPHSFNEVRSSTFVMASKMARGLLCSLAIPILAYLYHCFNRVANSSIPGKKAVYGPFQYFFGWMSIYFPKTYSHGNPSNGTNVIIELPSTRHLAFVTEPSARWGIASSFVVLQFSPKLKRKQSNQPKTSKKRITKTAAPIILDTPSSSQPDISTLRRSSFGRSSKSSGMLLGPDKAARPSPRRYLLKILESKCRHFYGTPIHFEFENPEAVICPFEIMFPENFDHSSQEFVSSLDQFRAYIDSLFEGKDSILEGKDVPAILNIFEKGRELLVLGRVKASIEAPSLPLSSEYSASASNRLRGQSKHDSQGEMNDEDDESEDETDEFYNYTPLSLPSKSTASSVAMASFKDYASSKNSWQANSSNSLPSLTPQVQSTGAASFDDLMDPVELEGLIARIDKPSVQSIPLSSCAVKALVKYSVLWTKVLGTSDKDVSLGELEAQYEVKKTNFDEMASSYEEMASSVSKLSERVTSLEEEDLHVALDVVEQCKKKSAHYDAVKEALDAARASLMD